MLNKVMLIGHLGGDPELRYTQSGVAVASFSVATNERWKDKDGQQQEQTEWHRIVAWRHRAEFCNTYLHKGSKIYLEGKLQTRKWQDQNGNDRYTTEIVAFDVQFLTPKGESGGSGGPSGNYDPGPEPPSSGGGYDNFPSGQSGGSGGGSTGSDVPF
ncbi:MAG: single-stranded DNA-binding protein [Candidatus Electrothrix sp. AU1_5]|nr:single-stranded DNA-binding protein [Candidatus Electrothrix sp. AX1]MCI5181268.1 single-stranded DNA-binding protein [Candidatus Electrothrix gigas]MCI5193640.1 single-stranded DNA-binding protein [Candidatus Electrothrix gigas]